MGLDLGLLFFLFLFLLLLEFVCEFGLEFVGKLVEELELGGVAAPPRAAEALVGLLPGPTGATGAPNWLPPIIDLLVLGG